MTILWLAESFKSMNRPSPTRFGRTVNLFDGLFLGNYKILGREILIQSSFNSSIRAITIWHRYFWEFGNYALFGNVTILVIFNSFFFITSDWNENFEIWWLHLHGKILLRSNCIFYFKLKNMCFVSIKITTAYMFTQHIKIWNRKIVVIFWKTSNLT